MSERRRFLRECAASLENWPTVGDFSEIAIASAHASLENWSMVSDRHLPTNRNDTFDHYPENG